MDEFSDLEEESDDEDENEDEDDDDDAKGDEEEEEAEDRRESILKYADQEEAQNVGQKKDDDVDALADSLGKTEI